MQPGLLLRILASSVLLILSFPGPDVGILVLVALVPLVESVRGIRMSRAFLAGWGAGTAWFFVSYNWVSHSVTVFGKIPLPLAEGIILLLAGIHGLYVAFFAMLVPLVTGGRARAGAWERGSVGDRTKGGVFNESGSTLTHLVTHPFTPIVVLPSLWVLLEVARSWFPAPFPWLMMGAATWKIPYLKPLYGTAGIYGVSYWIVTVNLLLWSLIGVERRRRRLIGLVLVSVLMIPPLLGPLYPTAAGERLKVGVVQGNFPQKLKWEESMRGETLKTYLDLTEEAVKQGARLVVWPETAVPSFYQAEPELIQKLRKFTADHRIHLIFGSPGYAIAGRDILLYNRVYHLPPEGAEEYYDKIVLVPFGEYIPMGKYLPFVDKMVPGEGEFARGVWRGPFRTPVPSGTLVCFEISIPSLGRQEVQDGSRILVNVTNDAWFGRSWGPSQHLAVSSVRAMENGVPVLRAANTGISAVIDRSGLILKRIPLEERGILVEEVEAGGKQTIYTRLGDWIVILSAAVISVYLLLLLTVWRLRKWTT